MRASVILFALALTGIVFAQDEAKPSGKFYGPLATGDWKGAFPPKDLTQDAEKLRRAMASLTPLALNSTCSVPLVEAQIPKDKTFTAMIVQPDMTKVEQMPIAKAPAPPCSK